MRAKIITSETDRIVEIESGEDIIILSETSKGVRFKWQTMDNKDVSIRMVNSNTFEIFTVK